jgi:hypothetical protein
VGVSRQLRISLLGALGCGALLYAFIRLTNDSSIRRGMTDYSPGLALLVALAAAVIAFFEFLKKG